MTVNGSNLGAFVEEFIADSDLTESDYTRPLIAIEGRSESTDETVLAKDGDSSAFGMLMGSSTEVEYTLGCEIEEFGNVVLAGISHNEIAIDGTLELEFGDGEIFGPVEVSLPAADIIEETLGGATNTILLPSSAQFYTINAEENPETGVWEYSAEPD